MYTVTIKDVYGHEIVTAFDSKEKAESFAYSKAWSDEVKKIERNY